VAKAYNIDFLNYKYGNHAELESALEELKNSVIEFRALNPI